MPTLFLKVTVTNESDVGRGLSPQAEDMFDPQKNCMDSQWLLSNPLEIKGTPRYLALLHFRLRIAALGPQPNKNPTQPTKNLAASWNKNVATPQSFTSKVCGNSHVHLNSLHNKNSQVLIFHSHESQPLKGNVTSSSAMEDDLNHRNSTGFQIFFQGSQHLPLVEEVESLSPTSTRACFVDKNMNVVTLYCTKNIYVSYNHVFFCNYI